MNTYSNFEEMTPEELRRAAEGLEGQVNTLRNALAVESEKVYDMKRLLLAAVVAAGGEITMGSRLRNSAAISREYELIEHRTGLLDGDVRFEAAKK